MRDIHGILKKYWGYPAFRPMQEEIITSVMDGKDTLGLLPTGGGKSICFQVPALAMEGVCVVISPLIALMKDQVMNLQQRKIPAKFIVSGMSYREIDIVLDQCVRGEIKFLYVSPERLLTQIFRMRFERMNVNMIAVDEAHCISQWGYDFRPSYMRIAEIREMQPDVPVIALTATATPDVVDDIQERLGFKEKNVFKKSFVRENLAYVVQEEEGKLTRLLKVIQGIGGSGVVYVRSRKRTKSIADFLKRNKIAADFYHAGLSSAHRDAKQANWVRNKTQVIVATNAFGMGIDKSDVRFVVHMDLPDSMEAYFQEAGRGGRDGKKAFAIAFYTKKDIDSLKERVSKSFPDKEFIKRVYGLIGGSLRIATGAGAGQDYKFNVKEFVKKYDLSLFETHYALKILQLSEYMDLPEEPEKTSKVMVKMRRDDLYNFQVKYPKYDGVIKLLLRSYPGLYDSYKYIDEEKISDKVGYNEREVRMVLRKLHEMDVLEYIEADGSINITLLRDMTHPNYFRLTKESYDLRKEQAFWRMDNMINYITSTHRCRSRLLVEYFGDINSKACGHCDICLEEKKKEQPKTETEQLILRIKELISQDELSIEEVLSKLNYTNRQEVLELIRGLIDDNKIVRDKQEKYHWKEE